MSEPPKVFDRTLHARRLERASTGAHQAEFLKVRVAEDLVERLVGIQRTFALGVDLGAGGGLIGRTLADQAPAKVDHLVETDLSTRTMRRDGRQVVADEERLPFVTGSLDLVVSALALHWVNDLVGTLIQIRRALRPDGLFIGALLGGATLTELRQSLTAAEDKVRGGAGPRVSPFVDAPDGAALLQRAGFALPVVDTDKITVLYESPLALIADLRAMGETNVLVDRPRLPLTRPLLQEMCHVYVKRFSKRPGRIEATFEIITLTGWAPHPSQPKPLPRGSATTPLEVALRRGAETKARSEKS